VVDRVMVEDSRVVIQHIVPTRPVRLQTEQQPLAYAVHCIFGDM